MNAFSLPVTTGRVFDRLHAARILRDTRPPLVDPAIVARVQDALNSVCEEIVPEDIGPRPFRIREILVEVAHHHSISIHDIRCDRRFHRFCLARQEACYRLMAETYASTTQIAKHLGGRDHTTVIYSAKQHAKRHGLQYPPQNREVVRWEL